MKKETKSPALTTPDDTTSIASGATAVITHRVRADRVDDYERWVEEIMPLLRRAPGYLDRHRVLPVPGLTETYTIILRFDTAAHLKHWMNSAARTNWIKRVGPFLKTGDDFFIRSGLDFWFMPEKANAVVPKRWKQFLVSWSAVIPLSYCIPLGIGPLLKSVGLGGNRLLTTVCVTGVLIFLLIYVVMPRYTRLVKRWLFS